MAGALFAALAQLQGCFHAEDDMSFAAIELPFMPAPKNVTANALGTSEIAIVIHATPLWRST
jgi:hypothetical protein